MIAFDLQCTNGHGFEGWFEDSGAYETQHKKGLISCPVCGDGHISKIPSTFSIRSAQTEPAAAREPVAVEALTRKIAHFVKNHFDDVGCEFTKEALKIHYGVAEPRNIRGVSTKAEEKVLAEEGVLFFKVPVPVETDTEP